MTYMPLAVDHGPMSSLVDLLDTTPFLQAGMHILIHILAEVMCFTCIVFIGEDPQRFRPSTSVPMLIAGISSNDAWYRC
jgi:hypothetical protein